MNRYIALFQRLTQGVYVVGVAPRCGTQCFHRRLGDASILRSLAADLEHQSASFVLPAGRAFSVNVLKKGQLDLAEHYGQPAPADKLAGTEWTTDRTGLPLLREALAWFECEFLNEHPAGDHVLVLGKVIGGKLLDSEDEPMSYRATGQWTAPPRYFPMRSVIRANTARTGPTFLADACFGGMYGLSFAEATQTATAIGGASVRFT